MKITKSYLKQIIKEELDQVLKEAYRVDLRKVPPLGDQLKSAVKSTYKSLTRPTKKDDLERAYFEAAGKPWTIGVQGVAGYTRPPQQTDLRGVPMDKETLSKKLSDLYRYTDTFLNMYNNIVAQESDAYGNISSDPQAVEVARRAARRRFQNPSTPNEQETNEFYKKLLNSALEIMEYRSDFTLEDLYDDKGIAKDIRNIIGDGRKVYPSRGSGPRGQD